MTRRNPQVNKKQLTATNKEPVQPNIPEITPRETDEPVITTIQTEIIPARESILVQTDPLKNPPLTSTNGKGQREDKVQRTKSDMVRERRRECYNFRPY